MNGEIENKRSRKQFPVYLDIEIYEVFSRLFPHYGDKQLVVRATIHEIIRQSINNPQKLNLPDAVTKVLNLPSLQIRLNKK